MTVMTRRNQSAEVVSRTSWPDAVVKVVQVLHENRSQPMTIQEIAKQTALNWRTVEKTTTLLRKMSDLSVADFVFYSKGRTLMVELKPEKQKDRFGMLDLPSDVQNLVIRTRYFPQPSKEEEILVNLYLNGAIAPEKARTLETTPTVEKLEKQGHLIGKENSRYFLSETGKMIAGGALEIYPELLDV